MAIELHKSYVDPNNPNHISAILDFLHKLGYKEAIFDRESLTFKRPLGPSYTNMIGIGGKYIYVNPCKDIIQIAEFIRKLKINIRNQSIDSIIA